MAQKVRCPVCDGLGHLPVPHVIKKTDADRKRAYARALANEGYSMRQIMAIIGWKSVNSVTKALRQ